VLRLEIFTRTKDWPRLASAQPKVGCGPPQKIVRENLKFGLKFSVLRSITSGLVGVSSRDFFQSTLREAGVIIWVQFYIQFLQGPPPEICDGQIAIFDNLWLWSRISPERINISKIGKALENLQPLTRWTKESLDERKLVFLGPQTKMLLILKNLHPNGLFSGDYILALSCLQGAAPSNFYTRYRLT